VDFGVNYVNNDATSGEARIFLDLNDYPNIYGQEVYMKGTYYKVLSDLAGVRVYGDIANLAVIGDGVTTVAQADTTERVYTAYVDKVMEKAAYINSSTGDAAADTDVPGTTDNIVKAGNLDDGILYTTIGPWSYEYQGAHSYDLVLNTSDDIYLYGIQGVWNTAGFVWEDEDDMTDDNVPSDPVAGVYVYTPWAIYEDNSDGN